MKNKLIVLLLIAVAAGCSLLGSTPTKTVEQMHAYAESGDIAAMDKLFSSTAQKEIGKDTIHMLNKEYSDNIRQASASGAKASLSEVKETINGDTANVSFHYGEPGKSGVLSLGFDLSKEGGVWKIDRGTDYK